MDVLADLRVLSSPRENSLSGVATRVFTRLVCPAPPIRSTSPRSTDQWPEQHVKEKWSKVCGGKEGEERGEGREEGKIGWRRGREGGEMHIGGSKGLGTGWHVEDIDSAIHAPSIHCRAIT